MEAVPVLVGSLGGCERSLKIRFVMKTRDEHVLIVGGGVIGLCCAYYLGKAGHRVTVVDRDASRRESCSEGNAGMVVPSHFTPMAAPGVVSQGLKWMLDRRSPFYLRPRLDQKLLRWGWQFLRHSNSRHVQNTQTLLRDLGLESRALFSELAEELDFELVERGLLTLCRSHAGFEEEKEVAAVANQIGIPAEICGPERLRELDPEAEMKAVGGVWFSRDAHLDPSRFLEVLRVQIKKQGGTFRDGCVVGFASSSRDLRAVLMENGEEIAADRFVLAGGAWTPELAAKLGHTLPLQAGKGYSFTLAKPRSLPRLCSLLKEGRVAVTPMGDRLRVAGTMEICGNDLTVDPVRAGGIIDSFCQIFPEFCREDFSGLEPWSGLRPCSPDGLPFVGRVPGYHNGIIATGHAMLGLSLGPVTGRLVSQLVMGAECDRRLGPGRFGVPENG
jgi:D-amino-acid dehydrogenase